MSVHCSPSPGSRESGLRPQGGQVPSGGDRARGRFPGRGSQPGLQLTSLWGHWGRLGWQFWAPRRLPGLDRGEHHHHCPLLPSWGRRGPGHRPAPSPGSAVLFSWGGAAGARARGRHAGTGRTARRSASTSRPNTRRQAGPAPGGLFRAAPLCPLSLPRMLPAGKGQPWPPSPCLSPSPNPIHLPSPVLGSSYPRQPPLTPAPTSGLPPLLQHPRGSPKWRWQQAGIWGH